MNIEVKHRPCVKMSHIDALSSGVFVEEPTGTENEMVNEKIGVLLTMTEQDYVITMQRSDSQLREIISVLSKNDQS